MAKRPAFASINSYMSENDGIQRQETGVDLLHVYYNHIKHRYEFSYGKSKKHESVFILGKTQYQNVAKLNITTDEDMKWGMYVNKLTKQQKRSWTKTNQKKNLPNGYWLILNEDHTVNQNKKKVAKSVKDEMAPIHHLHIIHHLLNHYYEMNTDKTLYNKWGNDNTPLRKLYCKNEREIIYKYEMYVTRINKNVVFFIEGIEYQLTWWNQIGKYETNAIAMINLTKYKERVNEGHLLLGNDKKFKTKPVQIELCYMRFEYNPKISKVQWQWYNNDISKYEPFDTDDDLTAQLEASYLSNIKQQFDPTEFGYKFNNCLLTTLKKHLKQNNKEYTFRVSFSPENDEDIAWRNVILSMQQISWNYDSHHNQLSPFERAITRLYEGRNSLDFLLREKSDKISRQWKVKYRLYTKHQQLYFFAFIISIVTMMKYIDIEFSSQPVLIPGKTNEDNDNITDDVIQSQDAVAEQRASDVHEGSLIPPNEGSHRHSTLRPSKTKILKKTILSKRHNLKYFDLGRDRRASVQLPEMYKSDEENTNTTDNNEMNPFMTEDVYIQDKEDLNIGLCFNKDQAEFLRLMECVRKYVLEYEAGNKTTAWPWYRNSFHTNETCNDVQKYDEYAYKFDLVSTWTMSEVMMCLKDEINKCESKEDKDSIRFKRKYAARILLNPPLISRNINLLRNQLDSLLKDIMDKALTEHFNKGNVSNQQVDLGKTITLIALKQNLTKRHQDKQQAITNYCSNQILGNLQTLQELKKDDITKIIHNICQLNHDSELPETVFVRFINEEKIDGAVLSKKYKKDGVFVNALIEKSPNSDEKQDEEKKDDDERYKTKIEKLWKLFTQHISSKQYWNTQLEETNRKFKNKIENKDRYGLFDENIKNLQTLDIDRYELPIFREFVQFFFVNSDKEQYNLIADQNSHYLG
eukprot:52738_1